MVKKKNEELIKKKQKRQRDNKSQKLREKPKRSSESVLREELIVTPEITHNINNNMLLINLRDFIR
jgi:hypothetical protein